MRGSRSARNAHLLTKDERLAFDNASARGLGGDEPWLAVAVLRACRRARHALTDHELAERANEEFVLIALGKLMSEGRVIERWDGSSYRYTAVSRGAR